MNSGDARGGGWWLGVLVLAWAWSSATAGADEPQARLRIATQVEGQEEAAAEEGSELQIREGAESETPGAGTEVPTAVEDAGGTLLNQAHKATEQAKSEEDFSAIIEMCSQALEMELNDAQVAYANSLLSWTLNRRGEVLAASGVDDQALADFEEAVRLDPNRWKAIYNRGVSYAQDGRLEDALLDFNRTIQLKPEFVRAHFNRGEVRFARGEIEASLDDYNEALRLAPRNAETHAARGFAHYSLGNVQEALRDFTESIRINPENPSAYVSRGDTYGDLGDFARATQDYRRALEIDPRYARAYVSWGWLMATCPTERFRNSRMALEYAQAAVRLEGQEHYRYLEVLAAAHANAGQFAEAREAQSQAIALAPEEHKPPAEARLTLYSSDQPYRDVKLEEQDGP